MRDILSGTKVMLTAIKETDSEILERWFNDGQFLRHYDLIPALPKRSGEVKKMLESYSDSTERYMLAIRLRETQDLIGILGFEGIIWSNRVATLFIGIGDHRYTSQGLGKEAVHLLLDLGFNELNFYRIQLNVIAYNEVAIKLYESLGFVKEGTYRQFLLRDGKRYDVYLYGILQEEWQEKSNSSSN